MAWAPGRKFPVLLAAATLLPIGLLCWLGLRLLEQDLDLERQRRQESLKLAASQLALAMERRLGNLEEQLAKGAGIRLTPVGLQPGEGLSLLYRVDLTPSADTSASEFQEAETLELQRRDLASAAAAYRRLAAGPRLELRAGALVRLGRVLRRQSDRAGALAAYDRLQPLGALAVEGQPAEYLARQGRSKVFEEAGDAAGLGKEVAGLARALYAGDRPVDRVTFGLYRDMVERWGGPPPRAVRHGFDWLNPRDWTPDGTWILAAWHEKNASQLGFIRAQDGSLRVLKSDTREFLNAMGLSPNGTHLVYTRATDNTPALHRGYIMAADASSDVPLLTGAVSVESAAWTPDGSRIVFVSNRSGSQGLWSVRVADGKPAGEPELLKADFNGSQVMGFGRDGSLFYSVLLSPTDIYIAGLDPTTGKLTSEPRRVNERAIGNSSGRVAWLPDGKTLSFWNRKPAEVLVAQSLANGEVRELWGGKTGRLSRGYAGWFPDGVHLMAVNRGSEAWEFQRVDSRTWDTLATWTVPAPPAGSSLAFSPDLMTMFFWRRDEAVPCEGVKCTHAMVARSLQTGRDHELFRLAKAWSGGAAISPDGRDLAFTRRDGQTTSVVIAPTGGGAPRVIHREAKDVVFPEIAWTRDGGHVLTFFRGLSAGGELWSFPSTGGVPERSPLPVRPSETPAVSPDGTQIAFVGGTSKSEVWVMTGLFKDAKDGRR